MHVIFELANMSRGIDYSKWDKILKDLDSDSDSNENDVDIPTSKAAPTSTPLYTTKPSKYSSYDGRVPQVTRLKNPSSVTIGPNGATLFPSSVSSSHQTTKTSKQKKQKIKTNSKSKTKTSKSKKQSNKATATNTTTNTTTSPKPRKVSKSILFSNLLEKWTHNGGISFNNNKRDDGIEYFWSQTRDDIVIRFLIPSNIKSKDIEINMKYDFKTESHSLTVLFKNNFGICWINNKKFSKLIKNDQISQSDTNNDSNNNLNSSRNRNFDNLNAQPNQFNIDWEIDNIDWNNVEINLPVLDTKQDDEKKSNENVSCKDNNSLCKDIDIDLSDCTVFEDRFGFLLYSHEISKIFKEKGYRLLKFEFEKHNPQLSSNVINWWKCVFEGDKPIDMSKQIKDRRTSVEKMKNLWNSANKGFLDKIRQDQENISQSMVEPTKMMTDLNLIDEQKQIDTSETTETSERTNDNDIVLPTTDKAQNSDVIETGKQPNGQVSNTTDNDGMIDVD